MLNEKIGHRFSIEHLCIFQVCGENARATCHRRLRFSLFTRWLDSEYSAVISVVKEMLSTAGPSTPKKSQKFIYGSSNILVKIDGLDG